MRFRHGVDRCEVELTSKSLLLVNTGDGRGKSSSAVGVLLRAWAREWDAVVYQFMKGPKWKTSEQKAAVKLGIPWHVCGDGFTWESTDLEASARINADAWIRAKEAVLSGNFDLVVLDELTYVMNFGWVDSNEVLTVLDSRPARTNIVVTGRDASDGLIALADTVTTMQNTKHAFDAGITARRGIDY